MISFKFGNWTIAIRLEDVFGLVSCGMAVIVMTSLLIGFGFALAQIVSRLP